MPSLEKTLIDIGTILGKAAQVAYEQEQRKRERNRRYYQRRQEQKRVGHAEFSNILIRY